MSDEKKLLGEEKKKERQKAKRLLGDLKGKEITKLTKKEMDDLLQVICLMVGISNKNGIIQ